MVSYEYLSYVFLFGRLAVFVIIVVLLILFGVILIKAAKKRREKRNEAIHQLFHPEDTNDGSININIDPSVEENVDKKDGFN